MAPTATAQQRIAANLRAEVARAGLNRREFAARMGGWSASSTGRRLDGEQPMTIDMLAAAAAALEIPLATLLDGVDEAGQVPA